MPRSFNWLTKYLEFVQETESPERFKLWAGISALSATLKRRVWVDRIHYILYPQQYIILVGPPGVGKGTAIHPAINLVKKADCANIIADRVTAEKVVERLQVGFPTTAITASGGVQVGIEHSATIVVPELPVYLNASSWTLEFMCEMFDRNEWEYSTKGKGSYKLKDLCIGLIGGCVPDFIRKLNSHDSTAAVAGGFTSRCVFIYETKKSKRNAWPSKNSNNTLEQQLIDELHEITSIAPGEFSFSKDAKLLFENFYLSQKIDEFESDVLTGFKERIGAHIFKTAMTLSISESNSRVIELRHLKESMNLVEQVQDQLDITFRSVGESSLAVALDRVARFIEVNGMASRKQILLACHRHITDEDLTKVLYTLTEIGHSVETDTGGKTVYTHNKQFNKKPAGAAATAGRP